VETVADASARVVFRICVVDMAMALTEKLKDWTEV
jgi:hypothetical protein